MFENQNEILNIDELCELLDIGKNTAYNLLKSGHIKALKIGVKWKVPVKSVEDYILRKAKIQSK